MICHTTDPGAVKRYCNPLMNLFSTTIVGLEFVLSSCLFSLSYFPFFVIGNGAQKAAEQLKEVLISGGSLFVFIFALHEQHLSWIAFLLGDNEKIVPKFLFRGDFLFLTLSPYLSPSIFSILAVVGECFLAWRASGWVSRYCLPYKRCSF